ncbi:MAG: hypothetical protein KatS3mg077_1551 [Candidatus Binatia bacterium]|nr:MAG: hypothetical protein KatS3mg077_1541 [Candidatus Binatia bacterium]GIW44269.1 MAG: hypothetical protein KatS3mg077_1551 [Candidatus Binatia bacterium]
MRQRSSSRCGSSWGRWWVVFVLLPLAVPTSAATFTHPQEGFTIWYPDGWHVHERPAVLWAVHDSSSPTVRYRYRVQLLGKQPAGVVVSSCPARDYLSLRGLEVQHGAAVIPEGHAEVAVVRDASKPTCESWMGRGLEGLPDQPETGGDPGVEGYRVVVDGNELRGWRMAQVLAKYPVFKILLCRPVGDQAYLFRLSVAGMFTDYLRYRADFDRMVRSLRVKEN